MYDGWLLKNIQSIALTVNIWYWYFILILWYLGPKFVEKLKNLEAHVGKTIILDCVCEAEPEPDIDWLFNGKIVRDQGRLVLQIFKVFLNKSEQNQN